MKKKFYSHFDKYDLGSLILEFYKGKTYST